ncbi:MAG: ArsR/SmtB family transcription factor [Dermatophilaceae bacterium]
MSVTDPAAVRMLAHPLRTRLVTLLRTDGPASATELAGALGTNSGATSYHLRRLESVGLVADTGTGTGKTRIWRARDPAPAGGPDTPDVNTRVALSWIERDYVRHVSEKADEWLDVAPTWAAGWTSRLGMRDAVVLVTQQQLGDLQAEIAQVLARYRRVGQGNPGAKRVAVYTYAYPVDFAARAARERRD